MEREMETMTKIDVQVKIIDPRYKGEWGLPAPGTPGSAGIDLRAVEAVRIHPGEAKKVRVGLAIHIKDPRYVALVMPRSGLGMNKGIVLGNLTGVIDSDFQGELVVCLWNRNPPAEFVGGKGNSWYDVQEGDRVAQLLLVPVKHPDWKIVEEFEQSDRGTQGYGSTGK